VPGGYGYVGLIALARIGRVDEALEAASRGDALAPAAFRAFIDSARALIEERRTESAQAMDLAVRGIHDPEVLFYAARHYAYLGESARALGALEGAVRRGYYCLWRGRHDAWFDAVRQDEAFARLVDASRIGHDAALAVFRRANGDAVLRSVDP
jgi:hypothetical protein